MGKTLRNKICIGQNLLQIGIVMLDKVVMTEYLLQKAILEPAMQGHDMVGRAKTGTGKILASGIPIIDKIIRYNDAHGRGRNPMALVLALTRELARQVEKEFQESSPLDTLCVYGGTQIMQQIRSLQYGVDVVVGTPGRVIDLLEINALVLAEVQFFVLDEVDQVLVVGFADNVEKILGRLPQKRQSMMFSATMPPWIKNITRQHLNNPVTIDLAWFRELPTGVLDSLTPDQVMHCNTEEECSELVRMLPAIESALLDWAINLMADVVENEHHNKMNARIIAMVFAPNMTQMADPLSVLFHAVQVMNFLKTLIIKRIREREDTAAAEVRVFHSCSESPRGEDRLDSLNSTETSNNGMARDLGASDGADLNNFSFRADHSFKYDNEERFHCSVCSLNFSFRAEQSLDYDNEEMFHCSEGLPITSNLSASKFEYSNGYVEGILHRLSFREGVRKLCRHPVFQLSKLVKKPGELDH